MTTQQTIHSRIAGCGQALPALLAAVLLLGGCAATYVDDAWQCPLAQGEACTSVAEADPAVTRSGETQAAKRELTRSPETARPEEPAPGFARSCGPLGWLAEFLGGGRERGGEQDGVPASFRPGPVPPTREAPDENDQNLRTKERIARIWIAPFVDARGVYREGHWVRAVLEPARWRLR